MTVGLRLAAALVAAFFAIAAAAQTPSVTLDGTVKAPRAFTLDDLQLMPAETVEVSYQTDRGPVTARFTGVLLWTLIAAAGGIDDSGKGAELRHAIRITATDGYVVVTSTGELAPDFGGKPALLAYRRDGQPLPDLRIVMPGDKHGGRNVREVTAIRIE